MEERERLRERTGQTLGSLQVASLAKQFRVFQRVIQILRCIFGKKTEMEKDIMTGLKAHVLIMYLLSFEKLVLFWANKFISVFP